jgi:hypothetical protein
MIFLIYIHMILGIILAQFLWQSSNNVCNLLRSGQERAEARHISQLGIYIVFPSYLFGLPMN